MAGYLSSAELASITTTVAGSLDVSLPLYRNTGGVSDGFGTETEVPAFIGNIDCNIITPTATQLQPFAAKIGSQRAMVLRVMQSTDVRENDQTVYDSLNWRVQGMMDAESYTVTKEYMVSVIAP